MHLPEDRMTADKLGHFAEPEESLYEFITRLVSAMSYRALVIMLGAALGGGIALAALSLKFWPLMAACGTVGAIAGWGLLEHRRVFHPSRWLRPLERVLVFVGGVAAFIAVMGFLYSALGTGWIS
jgi:hypothetical protein